MIYRNDTPPPLFAPTIPTPRGETFDPARDLDRLCAQGRAVWDIAMQDAFTKDGYARSPWLTLRVLSTLTGHPEASVSARLRDFRRMPGVQVLRRRVEDGNGLHEYAVVVRVGTN